MYFLLRKLLFRRDPESAHESAISLLEAFGGFAGGRAFLRTVTGNFPRAPFQAMGLSFTHPVGVAAGFDKNARCVLGLQELGFSHVEIGTVTPRPQPGNPRPRLWRFPGSKALVNSLGFPGEGMLAVRRRLQALRNGGHLRIPLGVNLGKNADVAAADAASDYLKVLDELYEAGDYFVVNVSSPNTPGLRDLQNIQHLAPLLETVANRTRQRGGKPLLVKISPDLADADGVAIAHLARDIGLAGIVAANTTVRRDLVHDARDLDRGGLSGAPLLPRMHELLKLLRPEMGPSQALVASGGITSAERLRKTVALGANLTQVYTAFIYLGPGCVRKLLRSHLQPYTPPR